MEQISPGWPRPADGSTSRLASVSGREVHGGTRGLILCVDDDPAERDLVCSALAAEGYHVVASSNGQDGLEQVRRTIPDLVVSGIDMPVMNGLEFLAALRASDETHDIPFLFLTRRADTTQIVEGLRLGADDYVTKPFRIEELVARVHAKMERPSVPAAQRARDPVSGFLSPRAFDSMVERALERAAHDGTTFTLAYFGARGRFRGRPAHAAEVVKQAAGILQAAAEPMDVLGAVKQPKVGLAMLLHGTEEIVQLRLDALGRLLGSRAYSVGEERLRLTPAVGFAAYEPGVSADELRRRARLALDASASALDLRAAGYRPEIEAAALKRSRTRALYERLRLPLQIALTFVIGLILPFLAYVGLDAIGFNIAPVVYLVVVAFLVLTAVGIWAEGFAALGAEGAPEKAGAPHPPASAIIAAYLPNESETLEETIEAFLAIEYPADLQVILAYNTPTPMPFESVLGEIAARDSRFVPFKVERSTSKAQNVNAAVEQVTGEFVGVFDADHKPDPGSFARAWRWLSNGYDVVQGHCVVRNGDASWVARMIAVEFEAIYAVSHPGRARLHGFGIFGGSNGYWRSDLLAATRMRGSMLTEDIDSSMRVLEGGHRIASDPGLLSRELAPTSLVTLWKQRMRWAQGWLQVSLRHLVAGMRSPALTARNKFGFFQLLVFRELFPWMSLQILPLIAFFAVEKGSVFGLDWLVAEFVLATLFVLSSGPGQTAFAYKLAAPEVGVHRRWFMTYLFTSSFFYTEFKNGIARLAQLKEWMGEHSWTVTAR